jgi:uncharacterized protein (TIGR03435 family)
MTRAFAFLSIAAALSAVAFGQTAATPTTTPIASQATFEIADVHVSPTTRNPFLRGPNIRHGLFEMRNATMVDLIKTAYGVEAERVVGGPNWLEKDTFDVFAKVPEGGTVETAKPMLQALLAERFKLAVHNDNRAVLAYAVKVGKHAQMKQSDGTGDTGCKFLPPPPPPPPPASGGPPPAPPLFAFACTNMTMEAFAKALTTSIFLANQYLNGRLVVDETELKGAWNFDLKFTPRGMITPAGPVPGSLSLFDAVDQQLGLKLDPVEVPMPVIAVDSVNQKPTANSPDVAEKLKIPPVPTEFEVAELKPSSPDLRGMRLNIQPGGRVNIAGIPLKFLIEQAWNLTDDMVSGMPKWMETDRYDIVAKSPVPDLDIDDVWTMLRALVVERFKLTTHTEDRPVTAYTLVAVKPKLKKADPNSRSKYKEGPAADGKDPRDKTPILSRLVTCQNMTMAEFAAKLKDIAPGYIHTPVVDATGLDGGYDFTLSFSAVGLTQRPPGAAAGPGGPAGPGAGPAGPAGGDAGAVASDPTGAVTLFEAIEKQLGLKLEATKRPVPVLVIDHAEQKPTDN